MNSPTLTGGDDGARERTEVLEAEALLDSPTQHEPVAEQPEPSPQEPAAAPTDAEKRLAVLRERSTPARDVETGRFVPKEEPQQDDTGVEAEAPAEAAPEVRPSLPDGLRQGEDGNWYVDLTIDGERRTEPYGKYYANAQKYLTGDKRLQEATLARKAYEQEMQALRAEQSLRPPQGAGVNVPPEGGHQSLTREQLEKAIVEGDEQAQALLLDRLNREQQQVIAPPPVDIDQVVDARLIDRDVNQTIEALSQDEQYGQINAFITGNSDLKAEANEYSAQLYAEGYTNPSENVRMAVQRVRERLTGSLFPAPPPPPAAHVALEQRTAAKAAQAAANTAVGGQARQTLAVPPPAPPSTGSVLDQMRIARGLR